MTATSIRTESVDFNPPVSPATASSDGRYDGGNVEGFPLVSFRLVHTSAVTTFRKEH